ncbi:glutamyl-tRNA(Gln) amidotransferase subunit A [Rhizoctonia solani AG-3 Rhs1AP]|uniref:Glutamyl-tRNA(Gln) amidotransferase subunit A n=2 Tax=Rhizoctonia solani AG-3 TaxID=1086053 RepID=A0A074RHF2_9AGAM|nr:glutamyl-tRNA(Gln) amidotransferase subunit A [Rhizoctonia solani AG-3 Rhs1AP]KEP46551.1 glutamyl-tRNA(Gln) amidotransferase subunit A [Rhizoctonia solani 123E]
MSTSWEDIVAQKREDRANRLKPYADWSLGDLAPPTSQKNALNLIHARLTERERSFLSSDVTDLAQRLATRECTSLEVTTAFCKAAYAAQELTNCISEVMFAQGLARAQELDAHVAQTGRTVGPLHGVPISIKDHISVKGEDTAAGYVAWAGKTIAEHDATIVHILRRAGAIIYVKTTNPQAVFAHETDSNIYGYTTNPFNRELSSGGSSGGEGALIGSRAGLLGVGVPASWCGFYGLKPSSHRLPASGLVGSYKGKENTHMVIGPMAHSSRDLELFCRVISSYEPWNIDPTTLTIPWNSSLTEPEPGRKLVIGILVDDGVVAPHPPIVESMQKVRDALVVAGHEVVDFKPLDHMQAFELMIKLLLPDAGAEMRATLAESGEPAVPNVEGILALAEKGTALTLAETYATNLERDLFRRRALEHWNDTAAQSKSGRPVDAVLCPASYTLAPLHRTAGWVGYSTYWNLLDLPQVAFPVGSPFDASSWEPRAAPLPPRNPLEAIFQEHWDPKKFDGAPVGVTLVGRRWQEERLLSILKQVEDAVKAVGNP